MPLSLLIDEDTRDGALWSAIQKHNAATPEWAIDAVRVGDEDAPPLGTLDPEVLNGAIRTGRIIISRDASTLIAEHDETVRQGNWTPGLLIVKKGYSIPDLIEYLSLICHLGDVEEFCCKCGSIPSSA